MTGDTNAARVAENVVVIGIGGSGLRAAIELAERGTDVIAVGKRPKADAHTSPARGALVARRFGRPA
jgi:succinate dehydrogenase / fumarate reductase, flavoprotein subunit